MKNTLTNPLVRITDRYSLICYELISYRKLLEFTSYLAQSLNIVSHSQ